MLNDVTSNEEMVCKRELGLRDALLKFRGSGAGSSETEKSGMVVNREESMFEAGLGGQDGETLRKLSF